MKKFTLFFICTLFFNLAGYGQNFVWAQQMGGASSDNATSVCTDASGNVYSAGTFSGTSDFDPSTSTAFNLTATAGGYDIYISKLNSSGAFQWAVKIGNASTEYINGLATDASGNVYATGSFSGTVDFNPSATTNTLVSAGGRDIFVLKLTTAGAYSWAKRMGGISDDQGNAVVVDNSANVYTTGYYNGTANFNPAGTYTLTNYGAKDIYVSCLNSAGTFVWAQAMSGSSDEEGLGLSLSGSYLFVTGYFNGSTDFDRQTSIGYLTSFGSEDVFVSRRSTSTGGSSNTIQLGGTNSDRGFSVANDPSGNVLVTGYFRGSADFDPDVSVANLASTSGGYDAFICKLDGTVNMYYSWASKIGSGSYDAGQSIKTDILGNVYTTGNFGDVADFDPSATASYTITPGSMDVFVSKLTAAGAFVWAKSWGSTGGGDEGKSIALDASGNVYTTGRFTNTCDFDPSAGTYSLTTAGSDEIFVHKLSCTLPSTITSSAANNTLCIGTSATNTISIVSPEAGVTYSWSAVGATGVVFSPVTGTTTVMSYTASTSFSVVATGTNPCGSVSTTVSTVFVNALPSVSASASPTAVCAGNTLTLNGSGANSYTWSHGVTNGSAVTPTASLTYTVTGTDVNGCVNSATINVSIISNPTITVSGKNIACLNSPNILAASGASSYTWSPGSVVSSTINAQPLSNSVYTVNSQAANGCMSSATFSVTLVMPQTPDICEVTVDSISQYNNIIWDKTLYNNVDSFIVYREVSTNNYRRIGAQHQNAYSLFIDTARSIGPANGDPNITSYRYKLQIRDTCGNYSTMSPYHNTIYFLTNSSGSFFWNMYNVEFQPLTPISTFDLIRDNTGTNTWITVGSCAGNQTSLTDPGFSSFPNAIYRVIGNGFSCNATAKTAQQINKSKSNVKNNFNIFTGVSAVVHPEIFSVSPNPASSELMVSFSAEVKEATSITVTNVLGKIVLTQEIREGTGVIIPLNELAEGVYFIRVQQGKNYTDKKFIKN
ncbi:MAG: hypothetical protein K0S53_2161 [Bacteroidetes bacterium]|jgi:hypothetical protein|nr:hypothetical protein [Bacteroidota bacterium]